MDKDPLQGTNKPLEYHFLAPTEKNEGAQKIHITKATITSTIQDHVSISEKRERSQRPVIPEAPSIPKPNFDRIGMGNASPEVILPPNRWLANPSNTAAFSIAMTDFANTMSKIRNKEKVFEVVLRENNYDLGIEEADLAEALKIADADEQMNQAYSSFANAGMSALQTVSYVKSRGAAQMELNEKAKPEQLKLDKMLDDGPLPGTVAVGADPNLPVAGNKTTLAQNRILMENPDKDIGTPTKYTAAQRNEYNTQKAKVEEMTGTSNLHRLIEQKNQVISSGIETLKQTNAGLTSVLSASIKIRQGKMEAEKQKLSVTKDILNACKESAARADENYKNEIGKAFDLIKSTMGDNRAAHQLSKG